MNETELRDSLKAWIRRRAKLAPDVVLRDDTPILESGMLTSLDVAQLFMFIESLRGHEVDLSRIEPDVLTNVDTLYRSFLAPTPPAAAPAPVAPVQAPATVAPPAPTPFPQPVPPAGATAS